MKRMFKRILVTLLIAMATILVSSSSIVASAEENSEQATNADAEVFTSVSYMGDKSNVNTINATNEGNLPCIGNARVLVFYTDFNVVETPNSTWGWSETKDEVHDMFFSVEGKNNDSLAYTDSDSLRSYYYRSSYGKLDITGDVFEYQVQNEVSYYNSMYKVLNEILAYYQNTINWNDYDANNDGYIDGVYMIVKNGRPFGYKGGYVTSYSNSIELGDKKICQACYIGYNGLDTILHETCHLFGPPDMYAGVGVNPNGIATESIMNSGSRRGDIPSATKFVLGWLDNVQFVDLNNIGSFDLRSFSKHGDALVIYPNGNPQNRNWFFVEYVTKAGNNQSYSSGNYGVRIWKSQMDLDDEYNVNGIDTSAGMLPSPYQYLEAVHPDEEEDFYLQTGESLTPYTYPSTAYSDTFYYVGGRSKLLKDLTFSGIHISFDSVENEIAKVTVNIEVSPNNNYTPSSVLSIFNPDNTSSFVDSIDKILFASISCDVELKPLTVDVKLKDANSENEFLTEVKLSNNNRELLIYVDAETLLKLKKQDGFVLSPFTLYTYYDAVAYEVEEQTISFKSYPIPLTTNSLSYSTGFNMSWQYNMTAFKLSETEILTIYSDDVVKKLYWATIDLSNNTTTKIELEIPSEVNDDSSWPSNDGIKIWKDENYYYIVIKGYLCCYENNTLLSYLQLNELRYVGSDDNSFFVSSDSVYRAHFDGDDIQLDTVSLVYNSSYYKIKSIYSYVKNQYIIITNSLSVIFFDLNKDISNQITFTNSTLGSYSDISIEYVNNNYYVFVANDDLTMYQYDTAFNLVYQRCLLKNITIATWGCSGLNVLYDAGQWNVQFSSVSRTNPTSYSSTFLATFAIDGTINNYYRYGDASSRYECTIVPLYHGQFLGLEYSKFFYINQIHAYGEWINEAPATCEEEGRLGHYHCSVCDKNFDAGKKELISIIIPTNGHDYDEVITEPTCTEQGYTTYTCHCNDSYIDNYVNALGHTEVVDEAVAPTCTETGLTKGKHCSACKEVLIAQEIVEANGHDYSSDWHHDEHNHFLECVCSNRTNETEHIWDDGVVTSESTIKQEGKKTYTCSECGRTRVDSIPKKEKPTISGCASVTTGDSSGGFNGNGFVELFAVMGTMSTILMIKRRKIVKRKINI